MEPYELMYWWWSVPLSYDTKNDLNGTHILSNVVSPQGVVIILFKNHGLMHQIWT